MIHRSPRLKSKFTVINNALIEDERLHWADKGILIYLLSKPDNWQAHTSQLAKISNLKRDGIRASMKRLQEAGYVDFNRQASGVMDYHIYDEPQTDLTVEEKSHNRQKPQPAKAKEALDGRITSTDFPNKDLQEKPSTETPWEKWLGYRKKRRLANYATDAMQKRLEALPEVDQWRCVNYSIENNYQGVFPENIKPTEDTNEKSIRLSNSGKRTRQLNDYYDAIKRQGEVSDCESI